MKRNIENIVKHAEVSEKVIEEYLVKCVTKMGMLCLKYSNPNMVGYPDRLIVLPVCGQVIWVELKSKGKKPSAIQRQRFNQLTRMHHGIVIIDSPKGVNELCAAIKEYVDDMKKRADEAKAAEEGKEE
jgi:hypothetical protein